MPEMMNITVRNKIATKTDNVAYVCGNSDYVINFDFDSEWDAYDTKTARFAHDGQHTDVVFAGNQCNVPIITNTYAFHVGVFAGDLHTTTAARVPCRKSILCGSGAPANHTPDVYDQLMERMAQLEAPDWNQNDPAAKDYVKNRTHWVETTQKRYRDEALEFGDSTSVFFESPPWEMVVGQEYSVTWDGVAYVSECKSVSAYGSTFFYIGNSAIGYGGAPFAQNTGEPFCFTSASVYSDSAGKHSVDISYTMVITHKIDPKYLTDVESALTEQSRRVLGTDFSKFVTTTDKLYVRSQEVTQLIRTNSSSYDVLDSRTHDMFLITTPDGKTYKETIGSVELRLRTESGFKAVIPKKADGTNVTSDDLPLGCALLGLTWSDGLVLLNPRPKEPVSLPTVTTSDNGKILKVVDGAWAAATIANANGVSF